MTKYVISVDVPHPSLLPLGYQKLREIGWSVGTLFVPPVEAAVREVGGTVGEAGAEPDQSVVDKIKALIEEAQKEGPGGWCSERNCPSFYFDMRTGETYPCPHKEEHRGE